MVQDKIRIAIIGGSIGGCTLANGLLQLPNVEFDVFEKQPAFNERGAGVAIAPNAVKAIEAMGLDTKQMLQNADAKKNISISCHVVSLMR